MVALEVATRLAGNLLCRFLRRAIRREVLTSWKRRSRGSVGCRDCAGKLRHDSRPQFASRWQNQMSWQCTSRTSTDAISCPRESAPKSTFRPNRPPVSGTFNATLHGSLVDSESDEPWRRLLDQPEDDLYRRSIYELIVSYLSVRKRERQVIMVSHNANLVVGADSESVIAANRHRRDRKNRDHRRFDYKSGPLKHSQPLRPKITVLESRGISEYTCGILDEVQTSVSRAD